MTVMLGFDDLSWGKMARCPKLLFAIQKDGSAAIRSDLSQTIRILSW
jgi:hypothetical protein